MRFLLSLVALCCTLGLSAQQAILTGILDGDFAGQPKAIELYVNGTLDLSGYQLSRTNNGNVFTFPGGSTYADEFVYVVNPDGEQLFIDAFGTAGDFANRLTSNQIVGNGNDPYQLLNAGGTLLDQVGGDGTTGNIYQDGYQYRNDNTGPNTTWTAAEWINGNLAVDNEPITAYATIVPFGTYSATDPGIAILVSGDINASEDGATGRFNIRLSRSPQTDIVIGYQLTGTATENVDYTDPSAGTITIVAGTGTATDVFINPIDDALSEPTETIVLTITSVTGTTTTGDTYRTGDSGSIILLDNEPVSAIPIHSVQGSGNSSPFAGQTVTVEGIVVGDFQGGDEIGLGGFFLQEEDADADNDPTTSEGIWVFQGTGGTAVAEGDLVTATGVVGESDNLTQIDVTGGGSSAVVVSSGNTLPTAAQLDLPFAVESDLESFEGMRTKLIDQVVVTEVRNLGRFGEYDVSETQRLIQFTECNDSDVAALSAYEDLQDRSRITIDDGINGQNNAVIPLPDGGQLSATNTLRSGTSFSGLTGVLDERFGGYRLQYLTQTSLTEDARPATSPNVGGNLKVVAMNVLNYFTSLNDRGADTQTEFQRQTDKIVAAICELNADIIGLSEIQNNGFGTGDALPTLVAAVQAECGLEYDWVVNPNTGGDGIFVALIYRPSVVEQSGTAASLTTPSDVFSSSRVPVAQTFRIIETGNPSHGQEVTVVANHWKSKAGSCGAGDDDPGGAGSCDGTRQATAVAIRDWLATDPTGTGETDQLVIGDLNAYSQEAPLTIMTDAGFVNTVRDNNPAGSFPCGSVPSYVFSGQWGSLDHALASASLANKVTGAAPWQVNAPEPRSLDYNTEFNAPAFYGDNFYRFSDHDPVVVGLDLGPALPAELIAFTGAPVDGNVRLDWTTANEDMVDRFEVQRQAPDGTFGPLGSVAAAGNTTGETDYNFTDNDPLNGTNVYRLRIVDTDGTADFSDLVTVTIEGTNSVAELRQLGAGSVGLWGAAAGASYRLIASNGQLLRSGTITEQLTELRTDGLPAGVYFITLTDSHLAAQTLRFVVTR